MAAEARIETKEVSYRSQAVEGHGRKRVHVTYFGTREEIIRNAGGMIAYCHVGDKVQKVIKYGEKCWLPVGPLRRRDDLLQEIQHHGS